jgi:hypothetical protein
MYVSSSSQRNFSWLSRVAGQSTVVARLGMEAASWWKKACILLQVTDKQARVVE